MSKASERGNKGLTANFVRNAPVGKHSDRNGLYMVVARENVGSWTFKMQRNGKRHEIGLGSARDITLAQARTLAGQARADVFAGVDPRARFGRGVDARRNKDFTFGTVLERCFESLKPTLKGGGENGRWLSPLNTHVLPKWDKRSVEDITADDIRTLLSPFWTAKHETAKKTLNRIGMVLTYAADEGADVDELATTKAKRLLGPVARKPNHHRHTPQEDIPAFYAAVCDLGVSPATLAVCLALLTAHRSYPVRHARCKEFDLEAGIWTVPAKNLKGREGQGTDVRCPLSPEALKVVDLALPFAAGGKLFPAMRGGGVVSDVGMAKVFRRVGDHGTTHGLRSSFRDWCAVTGVSEELAEHSLQHAYGSTVARAYRRDDLLDQRREVLDQWASHATSERDAQRRARLLVV